MPLFKLGPYLRVITRVILPHTPRVPHQEISAGRKRHVVLFIYRVGHFECCWYRKRKNEVTYFVNIFELWRVIQNHWAVVSPLSRVCVHVTALCSTAKLWYLSACRGKFVLCWCSALCFPAFLPRGYDLKHFSLLIYSIERFILFAISS